MDDDDFVPSPAEALALELIQRHCLSTLQSADDWIDFSLAQSIHKLSLSTPQPSQVIDNLNWWDEQQHKKWSASTPLDKAENLAAPQHLLGLIKQQKKVIVSADRDEGWGDEAFELPYRANSWLEGETVVQRDPARPKFPPGVKKVINRFDKQFSSGQPLDDKLMLKSINTLEQNVNDKL